MHDIEHGVPSPHFRKVPKLEFNKDLVPSEESKHVELLPQSELRPAAVTNKLT